MGVWQFDMAAHSTNVSFPHSLGAVSRPPSLKNPPSRPRLVEECPPCVAGHSFSSCHAISVNLSLGLSPSPGHHVLKHAQHGDLHFLVCQQFTIKQTAGFFSSCPVSSPTLRRLLRSGGQLQFDVKMASSASYTESQTESQSSRGPHLTQWLPQLVLTALLALAIASVIGLSLSAVAFSSTAELSKPGHGIAQSFVMFAVCSPPSLLASSAYRPLYHLSRINSPN